MPLTSCSRAFDFSIVDEGGGLLGRLSVNGASERDGGSEDLLDGSLKGDGHGLVCFSHGLGNLEDIIELDVTVVGDVLLLLSISTSLLQGFNDEWGGGWKDLHGTLSVDDHDFNLDLDSLPLGGGLLDILTNFLWWETDWTTLWSEGGGTSDLSTDDLHVKELGFFWFSSFWWHCFACINY